MRKELFFVIVFVLFLVGCDSSVTDLSSQSGSDEDLARYNIHEHIQGMDQVPVLLEVMDRAGIQVTVLLGSPRETIFSGTGFTDYKRNNDAILEIQEKHLGRFIAFPTTSHNEGSVDVVKDFVGRGAKGIKLYNGHFAIFYPVMGSLNRSEMMPVYEYAEKNKIPIIYHVNPGQKPIFDEFVAVLDEFPDLIINCPHFCLSSINQTRFEFFMDRYPNMYTDISFGFYVEDGLDRVSRNREKFRRLFEKYPNRIMFGTDMVVTGNKRKTVDWVYNLTKCYIDMLEADEYECNVVPDLTGKFKGLGLDKETLDEVYHYSALGFLGID